MTVLAKAVGGADSLYNVDARALPGLSGQASEG
jgi:hypothetical protein